MPDRPDTDPGANGATAPASAAAARGRVPATPLYVEPEDTGRQNLRTMLSSAKTGELKLQKPHGSQDPVEQMVDTLASLLAARTGDGSSGGVPPEVHKKQIKRHNWLAVALAMVLGPGGALTVVYATSDRSKANEMKVEAAAKDIDDDIKPRLDRTENDVADIKEHIGKIDEKVSTAMDQQKVIVDGIEELKKENVDRLKQELRDARRELRRRGR